MANHVRYLRTGPLARLGGLVTVAASIVGASALLGSSPDHLASASIPTAPALVVPARGSLFGATVSDTGPQTSASFAGLETAAGRGLDIDRDYANWDSPEPPSQVTWDTSQGVIPLLSIDTRTSSGRAVSWSAIASGSYDTTIVGQARALASVPGPVLLAFSHEPEDQTSSGTSAQYVAAYQHYVNVFRAQGATNVSFAVILLSSTYKAGTAGSWYPGDAYVDWIGTDGYNSDGCRGPGAGWQDFSTIFSPFYAFAVSHSKPAVIAEWASTEDPALAGHKASWIAAAAQTIQTWPDLAATSYFDGSGFAASCKWPLTSSASAMAAFKAAGALPYMHPRPSASLSASTVSGPEPLTTYFNGSGSAGLLNAVSSWTLDFGDGSPLTTGAGAPPAAIAHTYASGAYTATLKVYDATGDYDQQSLTVTGYPPPTVTTGGASSLTTTSAALAGSLNPDGLPSTYWFEWGTTPSLGTRSAPTSAGSGQSGVRVASVAGALTPGTVYYWRLVAANGAGTVPGATKSLRTAGSPPAISGTSATLNSNGTVTFSATVNPGLVNTQWRFVFGPSTGYGSVAPAAYGAIAGSAGSTAVTATTSRLAPGTYHYGLVALNAAGTTQSADHVLVIR